jgi:cytochrome c oxidase accessory protein FixG
MGALCAAAVEAQMSAASVPSPPQAAGADESAPGVPRADAEAVNSNAGRAPLYVGRTPIYPKRAHGRFRAVKWGAMAVMLGIYYGLPWLRWDRGPGNADQAVLFDFAGQRLYIFDLEIFPQEFYFVTGILILSALGLFLVTSLAGRVWCGYACPQTVWTDLMIAVEHLWQGDRNERMRLAKAPWTPGKIWRIGGTHLSWIVIAFLTGGAFVFYFRDAPTLIAEFWRFEAPAIAYLFLGLFTATTYTLGGLAREQVCIYMCPWPRIQGAMFDQDSLLVSYRAWRGEPRGAHKAGDSWDGRGDCIDCRQCVVVCPTGIDIRDGAQLECIQCALCIDACDGVMAKIGRPQKLIAYDTVRNLEAGKAAAPRLVRPRTLLYAGAFAIVAAVMLAALEGKTEVNVSVIADRNPLFVVLSDGSIRNGFTIKVLNKTREPMRYQLALKGPSGLNVAIQGQGDPNAPFEVPAYDLRELKAFVQLPRDGLRALSGGAAPLTIELRNLATGEITSRAIAFRGPDKP